MRTVSKLFFRIICGWALFLYAAFSEEPNARSEVGVSSLGDYYYNCITTWCYISPYLPQPLKGHWVLSKNESWVIGSFGEAFHFSNQQWTVENLTLEPTMSSIEPLLFLWGNSEADGWALGARGSVYHSNGKRGVHGRYWERVHSIKDPNRWKGVWGQGGQVWAVSNSCSFLTQVGKDFTACQSELHHFDGKGWTIKTFPSRELHSVWGSSPSDVWVLGGRAVDDNQKVLHHFNGQTWSESELVAPNYLAMQGWSSGPNDVWVMGKNWLQHYNGKQWSEVGAENPKNEPMCCNEHLIGLGKNDLWIKQGKPLESGVKLPDLHWDGKQILEGQMPEVSVPGLLTLEPNSPPARYFDRELGTDIVSIVGSEPNDLWMVDGYGNLLHYDGKGFQEKKLSDGGLGKIVSHEQELWAIGNWASGENGTIFHFDGKGWSKIVVSALFDQHQKQWNILHDLWVSKTKQIWAVGQENTILHSKNGKDWDRITIPPVKYGHTEELTAVWGSSDQNVWIVSRQGSIFHWNGKVLSWVKREPIDYPHRFSGDHFMTMHWNATSKTMETRVHIKQSENAEYAFYGIYGTGPKDVWAVGAGGRIMHFDGSRWSQIPLPLELRKEKRGLEFLAVWALTEKQAWIVGRGGQILEWDGTALHVQAGGTEQALYGIWGSKGHGVWAVGEGGTILKLRENQR